MNSIEPKPSGLKWVWDSESQDWNLFRGNELDLVGYVIRTPNGWEARKVLRSSSGYVSVFCASGRVCRGELGHCARELVKRVNGAEKACRSLPPLFFERGKWQSS